MNLRRNQPATRRRGVILLVVLAMLTLFAIAGITFVLYANAASESARISRDAESDSTSFPDMDPSTSLNFFLAQLIYGVDDNSPQFVESALRGHSLAETMYGSWDSIPSAGGNIPSDVPYSGTGRLHEANLLGTTDGYNMVNYTYYYTPTPFQNADPTLGLRDPSCLGSRASLGAARGTYTGGQNAPYTYPDLNSMFLATINNVSTGGVQVVQPSFYRSWTGIGALNPATPTPTNPNPNPNWYNASTAANPYKYLTLRPRPGEMGPGFPPPYSTTGDVQNLVGSQGGNDSIWIDIGAPVLTTAAGLRYKMLVAPLILDLDSRINLNVVGNILANGAAASPQASNQGWGPWEVNMGSVLNAATAPNEWPNLFVGSAASRYGTNGVPNSTFTASGPLPHAYAQADLDAMQSPRTSGVTATPYNPASGSGFFPTFPAAYGNGTAASGELTNHPMFFNLFTAAPGNNLFTLKANAPLLWAGVSASPNSDLVKLCPVNFKATDPATISRIHQTTVLSMELDRPGASPYIYDYTNPAYAVAYGVTAPAPTGSYTSTGLPTPAFPTFNTPRQTAPYPNGQPTEFDPTTWRSTLAATLTRINLNRPLAAYPTAGPTAGQQPPDRQQFAMDIFLRLVNVTGMSAYYTPPANGAVTGSVSGAAQYPTLRWLAQLSANIVDFIDTDDVMTSFQWTTSATAQSPDTGYVFGTELPKLVVNEVYLEYDNDSQDPNMVTGPPPIQKAATKSYHLNVWAELVNPLPSANDPSGTSNNANLTVGGNTAYQMVVTTKNQGLRNPANLVGDPDGTTAGSPPFATQQTGPPSYTLATLPYDPTKTGGQVLAIVNNWQGVTAVTPVGTTPNITPATASGTSQGFLVVGPQNPAGTTGSNTMQQQNTETQIQTSVQANNLNITVNNPQTSAGDALPSAPTLLLQRLANPNIAYQPSSTAASYNPYVTVDYVDMSQVQTATKATNVINDARQYISTGMGTNSTWSGPPAMSDPHNRYSFGRNQPYTAVASSPSGAQWQQQVFTPANPAQTTQQPTTSFFSVNAGSTAAVAPDWLVHLDRPLISPIELLNVSGFKPHELTQQFYKDTNNNFQHVAPWTTESYLLYRLLEFVKTGNAAPGVVDGGRIPGKININTIDASYNTSMQVSPVFQALCDAQAGNTFNTTDVQTAYNALMTARTPSGTPAAGDKPFWSLAEGLSTGPNAQPGLAQTLLYSKLQNPTLNNPNATHPYQKMELLNKIFNNLTTRSNTFAVWLTVGFFPITNDQVVPNQLGPEINLANGRNIRHHMFAIVDRTQIMTFGNLDKTSPYAVLYSGPTIAPGTPMAIGINNPIGPNAANHKWTIQPGSTLVFDPGVFNMNATGGGPDPAQANEETVVVQSTAGVLTATFKFPHFNGANVISRGHPGPWNNPNTYSAASDTAVIPYVAIID